MHIDMLLNMKNGKATHMESWNHDCKCMGAGGLPPFIDIYLSGVRPLQSRLLVHYPEQNTRFGTIPGAGDTVRDLSISHSPEDEGLLKVPLYV